MQIANIKLIIIKF